MWQFVKTVTLCECLAVGVYALLAIAVLSMAASGRWDAPSLLAIGGAKFAVLWGRSRES